MTILTDLKYSFVSRALPEDAFSVIKFEGVEGLSQCYQFDVLLASEQPDLDLESVLESPAVFTIHREEDDVMFNGILTGFEQHQAFDKFVFYRAFLAPKLWRLTQTFHNQVFLDMTVPDILKAVLKDGGLTENDFELKLQGNYPKWEYICQYRESHFDFLSRWMERDGIYYYFDQSPNGEKLILTDSKLSHTAMSQGKTVTYSLPSGLDGEHWQEVVQTLTCKQQAVPEKVVLKDYNYRTPSLELTGQAHVTDQGRGEIYIYGEHFRTPDEGDSLAKIRAEEYLCQEKQFVGDSMVPYIQAGYTFDLKGHYRQEFDSKYLTVEVHHEGSQTGYLIEGLQKHFSEEDIELSYYNIFRAIPDQIQFRPPRQTEKARFYGAMNAIIDAEGGGDYAELDDMGRYKVILPFDRSGRKDGKASAFLRMMQPYVGSDHGMHFPLHKGAEVILTFIDGDPDRPIIAGTAPNPEHPSQATSETQTQCRLTTAGGNKIHIEDKTGSERILTHAPAADSYVRIGAVNDPEPKWGEYPEYEFLKPEKDGIALVTSQALDVKAGTYNQIVLGEDMALYGGLVGKLVIGSRMGAHTGHKLEVVLGAQTDLKAAYHWKTINSVTEMKGFHKKLHLAETLVEGETTQLQGEVTRVIGDLKEAKANANKARGELTKVTGSASKAHGKLTKAVGKATTIKGQLEEVTGSATTARQNLNRVVGEATVLRGEVTDAVNECDRLAGVIEQTSGTVTTIINSRSRLSGVDEK